MAALNYVGVTVTLTLADTNYNLLALIQAIEANCPAACTQLTIQNDPDDGPATLRIGDANLGAARCGYKLLRGDPAGYVRNLQNVLLGNIYLRAVGEAGKKVNVEVMAS